ncbi:putative reverse transcriptase domain-containing protein [Tanacetum coccineum]
MKKESFNQYQGIRYRRLKKEARWNSQQGDIERTLIMDEAYYSKYSVHPGANKMYYGLRDWYWWHSMKKDIVKYFSKCFTCLKVKAEYQRPSGLLQKPEIPNCLADPTLQVPLDEIHVDAKLNFVEEPVEILEREFKKLKHSRIAIVKVWWNSKRDHEFQVGNVNIR